MVQVQIIKVRTNHVHYLPEDEEEPAGDKIWARKPEYVGT